MKFPTPTEGSRIRTVSCSETGRVFIISVMRVLLVKKAAVSVRLVLESSAIRLRVEKDRSRGFSVRNSFRAAASDR